MFVVEVVFFVFVVIIVVVVVIVVVVLVLMVVVVLVVFVLEKKIKSKGFYICVLCVKEFKNGYNFWRYEVIYMGVKVG